ncbi:hypothetical protein K502DRAFT_362103 [Neoconidiobolus thromboides FSU 785]|nr:hypothetical protein K502DRAFT_362103 [Neoconidiobolus thromboides FSU 785]
MYFNFILILIFNLILNVQCEWDCTQEISIDNLKFNFKDLNKEYTISMNKTTKPTITETNYEINICDGTKNKKDAKDQCGDGTYICQSIVNYKDNSEPRVISLIEVANNKKPPSLSTTAIKGKFDSLHLSLSGETIDEQEQSTFIQFQCDKDKNEDPKILNYENGKLTLSWITKYACPLGDNSTPPSDPGNSPATQAGIAFSTIILLLILFYFIFGILYNYYVLNNSGWDLIPNVEFWQNFIPNLMTLIHSSVTFISGKRRRNGYNRV